MSFHDPQNHLWGEPELMDLALGTKANLLLETKLSHEPCRLLDLLLCPVSLHTCWLRSHHYPMCALPVCPDGVTAAIVLNQPVTDLPFWSCRHWST